MKGKIFVINNTFVYIYIQINVMDKKDMTLTSVKVQSDLFEDFKLECVKRKFSLQKLVDRAVHLYLTSDEFRKSIHNHNNLNR